MNFLEKVENAISSLEESGKTVANIDLNYGELMSIRKQLKLEEYEVALSAENLRKGINHNRKMKGSKSIKMII